MRTSLLWMHTILFMLLLVRRNYCCVGMINKSIGDLVPMYFISRLCEEIIIIITIIIITVVTVIIFIIIVIIIIRQYFEEKEVLWKRHGGKKG